MAAAALIFSKAAWAEKAKILLGNCLAALRSGFVALSVLAALMAGCGSVYRVDSVFRTNTLPSVTPNGNSDDFYYKDGKNYQIDPGSAAFKKAFTEAHAASGVAAQGIEEERARGARNALTSKILLLADDVCLQHKADIQGTATNLNLGLGSATTLFSGASTLATGTSAATLSAFATASNSTRSLVNEEVYQKAFSASILLAIDSDRASKKAPIVTGMKSSTTDYPIEMAIQQINEYHQSCSFVNGIEVISKSIQQRQKTKSQIQSEMEYVKEQIKSNSASGASSGIPNTDLVRELTNLQTLYLSAPQ